MKIYAVVNNLTSNNSEHCKNLRERFGLCWQTYTDSCITPGRRPFYIPDFPDSFSTVTATPALAVRICQLGKTIPERFASRYWSQFVGVINFRSPELEKELTKAYLPTSKSYCFDKSLFYSDDINAENYCEHTSVQLLVDDTLKCEFHVNDLIENINSVISDISYHNTIKNGDLIIPGLSPADCGVVLRQGQHLTLQLNNNQSPNDSDESKILPLLNITIK